MDIYTYTIVSTRDRLQSNEMGPNPWRGLTMRERSERTKHGKEYINDKAISFGFEHLHVQFPVLLRWKEAFTLLI